MRKITESKSSTHDLMIKDPEISRIIPETIPHVSRNNVGGAVEKLLKEYDIVYVKPDKERLEKGQIVIRSGDDLNIKLAPERLVDEEYVVQQGVDYDTRVRVNLQRDKTGKIVVSGRARIPRNVRKIAGRIGDRLGSGWGEIAIDFVFNSETKELWFLEVNSVPAHEIFSVRKELRRVAEYARYLGERKLKEEKKPLRIKTKKAPTGKVKDVMKTTPRAYAENIQRFIGNLKTASIWNTEENKFNDVDVKVKIRRDMTVPAMGISSALKFNKELEIDHIEVTLAYNPLRIWSEIRTFPHLIGNVKDPTRFDETLHVVGDIHFINSVLRDEKLRGIAKEYIEQWGELDAHGFALFVQCDKRYGPMY
ncbi:MAG: hypothetical protein KAU03_00575, partial [Candidatus Altiarchaeales archaeon]|nr:hypothetical protein [Candidatus Altiarchaeales archaeon]